MIGCSEIIHFLGIVLASIVVLTRLRLAWESWYELRTKTSTPLTYPMLFVNTRDVIIAVYVILYYYINFDHGVKWYGFPFLLTWLVMSIWGVELMRDVLIGRRARLLRTTKG